MDPNATMETKAETQAETETKTPGKMVQKVLTFERLVGEEAEELMFLSSKLLGGPKKYKKLLKKPFLVPGIQNGMAVKRQIHNDERSLLEFLRDTKTELDEKTKEIKKKQELLKVQREAGSKEL